MLYLNMSPLVFSAEREGGTRPFVVYERNEVNLSDFRKNTTAKTGLPNPVNEAYTEPMNNRIE